MKKLLILISIILLIIIISIVLINNITIGKFKIESIKDVKDASNNLELQYQTVLSLTNKEYPNTVDSLTNGIRNLKQSKEKYEAKTAIIGEEVNMNAVQIEKYKIEFLWTKIGNYATKEGIILTLDFKKTDKEEVYTLNFTVTGAYIGITNFLYDLENDDQLAFKIENFIIAPKGTTISTQTQNTNTNNNTTNTSNNINKNQANNNKTTSSSDSSTLQATFVINEVGVVFQ